ncbi:glycylpeptide N-tetradecanoyltransferase [[Candida] jaroonii]|uniref:Glycylpeptide N-tetradecanoyltransferase n=1 Tax=[Candida] jaroonii TaxID=467808 RepID=A0ACA9Y8B2_9ASCO|nr:glycylpeptide N-tetradecanoyltransferase [[Candida] jaroonii]
MADKKSIEELIKLISSGRIGELNEEQKKQMEDHKFWKTQPVTKYDEKIIQEGPIENKTVDDIPNDPLPLIDGFEWCEVDLDDEEQLEELYQLLYENYVEDQSASLRFKYSHEFFKWALKPPGYRKDWHLGVRVKGGKLVAFIAGTPCDLKLTKTGKTLKSVEINFLNIHKKLRSKRLAPVLIKEITRRVNKQDIWQALYTGGQVLPSPISTCRYTHRPINWLKLLETGFSHLPPGKTKSEMVATYTLPKEPLLGLRPMEDKDFDEVFDLFTSFQEKYEIIQIFTKEELKHWLNTKSNVIKPYVIEKDGKITDFVSYYLLPFTVLDNDQHNELGVAYLYYYATNAEENYEQRLKSLIKDTLITSKEFGVDVFNCLTSQDNPLFIEECKFGDGDGFLNYYLFNYKTFPIHGGINAKTREVENKDGGIGTVLL